MDCIINTLGEVYIPPHGDQSQATGHPLITRWQNVHITQVLTPSSQRVNPCATELLISIFRHLKVELLPQFPPSNDEKYLYL